MLPKKEILLAYGMKESKGGELVELGAPEFGRKPTFKNIRELTEQEVESLKEQSFKHKQSHVKVNG